MILIAGGTGRLGSLLARRLISRGAPVRVLTRDARRVAAIGADVEHAIGDVRDPGSIHAAMGSVQAVVSAVHGFVGTRGETPETVDWQGNRHLIDCAKAHHADVIMLSVVGANAHSPLELFRMKFAAERYLWDSGIAATVVRASAFRELWMELLAQTAARSGRPLVFGRGENPIDFVSVAAVAEMVDRVIDDRSVRGQTLEIGGTDVSCMNALAAEVQRAAGRTTAPRHIAPWMLRAGAGTVGRLNATIGRQMRAAIGMDELDLTCKSTAARERYAIST